MRCSGQRTSGSVATNQVEVHFCHPKPACDVAQVWMGVDVYGRGTWGGGQMNSGAAVARARSAGTSAALFAAGWAWYEGEPASRDDRNWQFWRRIHESCAPACSIAATHLTYESCNACRMRATLCVRSRQMASIVCIEFDNYIGKYLLRAVRTGIQCSFERSQPLECMCAGGVTTV